jgi:hypothetical protein
MNTVYKISLSLVISVLILSCDCTFNIPTHGSGISCSIVSAQRDFSGVDVTHGCKATITRSDTFSVVVHIDDNLREYVQVERSDKDLRIKLAPRHSCRSYDFSVIITMPDVAKLSASGASSINLAAFDSYVAHGLSIILSGASSLSGTLKYDDLEVSLSGVSRAKINGVFRDVVMHASGASLLTGMMTCRDVGLTLSGASNAEIAGSCRNVTLAASGGANALLKEFTCGNVSANLSGGSRTDVNASGKISGSLSSGSHLYYTGSATLGSISTSGGSDIAADEVRKP